MQGVTDNIVDHYKKIYDILKSNIATNYKWHFEDFC